LLGASSWEKLTGKVALIIGGFAVVSVAAIAKRLAADGARVAVTHSKGADAAAVPVVKEIERGGGKGKKKKIAIQADAGRRPMPSGTPSKRTVTTLGRLDVAGEQRAAKPVQCR